MENEYTKYEDLVTTTVFWASLVLKLVLGLAFPCLFIVSFEDACVEELVDLPARFFPNQRI